MHAPGNTVPGTSDRESLESWARHRNADGLQALVERYLGFVHSLALRRTGDAAQAAAVTRAVFVVLARRAQTPEDHRTAPLEFKRGEQPRPEVNAWRLSLHKEFAGACVKAGAAKARPHKRIDAFPELTFSHAICYLSLVSGIHL